PSVKVIVQLLDFFDLVMQFLNVGQAVRKVLAHLPRFGHGRENFAERRFPAKGRFDLLLDFWVLLENLREFGRLLCQVANARGDGALKLLNLGFFLYLLLRVGPLRLIVGSLLVVDALLVVRAIDKIAIAAFGSAAFDDSAFSATTCTGQRISASSKEHAEERH